MKIKEIEERCGLSSKTIRFYEKKGLLDVARGANEYRDYDEAAIIQLKTIKLLRKLGISIADILLWQKEELTTKTMISQQLQALEENKYREEILMSICNDIMKKEELPQDIDDFLETMDFIETEEFQSFSSDLHLLSQPSLFTQIIQSLIFLGPIAWLFLKIADHNQDQLLLTVVLSLLCTALLTISWMDYWKHRKEHKEVKKGNILAFIGFICSLGLGFFILFLIFTLQENLFINDGYIMFAFPQIYQMLALTYMLEIFVVIFSFIYRKRKNKDFEFFDCILNFTKKHKWILIIMNVTILYLCLFNIAVIYPDHIEVRRFYAPIVNTYTTQDIDHVETGFLDFKLNILSERKGDFYYYIYFKDGTKINISHPNPAHEQKYVDHTYLEIEEYDRYLMEQGIPKISSDEFYDSNSLGLEYKERFLKIVHNKQTQ